MTAYGGSRVDAEGTPHAQRFVVVLNQTQDVVNIATAVRAMMNMGMRRLRLVAPADYNAHRIGGIAHGSEAVLERAEFYDTLEDALADTSYAVGTTARRRTASFVWQYPRDAARDLITIAEERAPQGPVAIVFGREDKGLSNEDLDRCDRLLVIPTDPSYSSLNLAQAVLLITYELWLASQDAAPALPLPKRVSEPATPRQIADLFTDSHDTLAEIDFFKKRKPEAIMRTVRAVFRRAELNAREATLFRAIMIEVRKHARRIGSGGGDGPA
jgi:tRNA/rRNA methyltransferase/tRNA (cytidine32/uridine32-2'-O)-methyltransferase